MIVTTLMGMVFLQCEPSVGAEPMREMIVTATAPSTPSGPVRTISEGAARARRHAPVGVDARSVPAQGPIPMGNVDGQNAVYTQAENDTALKNFGAQDLQVQNPTTALGAELQCSPAYDQATTCCEQPEKCLFGSGESSSAKGGTGKSGGNSEIADLIQLGIGASLGSAKSISEQCGKIKNLSYLITALNAYLAHKCSSAIKSCGNSCGQEMQDIQQVLGSLSHHYQFEGIVTRASERVTDPEKCSGEGFYWYGDDEGGECRFKMVGNNEGQFLRVCNEDPNCVELKSKETALKTALETCQGLNNNAMKMVQASVVTALAGKAADRCKKEAGASQNTTAGDITIPGTCQDPGSQSLPYCRFNCDRPGASATVPECAPFANGEPTGLVDTQGPGGLSGDSGLPDGLDTGEQEAQYADIDPNNRLKIEGGSGGGGGGGLGGGDAGGGGGGDAGAGGYGGEGYDTSIDQGLLAGGGYTGGASRGPASVGGGGGFSTPSGGKNVLSRSMSLKDFLPKNKKPLAGLAPALRGLASADTDIFQRITDRFYQVCTRNALYDCATLKKIKMK
jgi:hypothetical protein